MKVRYHVLRFALILTEAASATSGTTEPPPAFGDSLRDALEPKARRG
jgi:hypothetical protein